jgi:hypothetical protein
MTIPSDAGLWSGGSRELFHAIDFATGEHASIPGQTAAPWDGARRELTVPIKPGFAIVEHSMFCGKDMGLTFYLHPDNATRLLPPVVELSEHERLMLSATASLKSSYGGKDRYEMSKDNVRYGNQEALAKFPTRAEWDAAKQSLIGRGLLNKAGAITVAGRNANK